MRQTVAGTTIGIALVAFVPAAIAATGLGWGHAWVWAFVASGAILAFGFVATALTPPA